MACLGGRLRRKDRIRGLGVDYKPSLLFALWRETEDRDWPGLHSTDTFRIPPPNKQEVIQWQKAAET